MPAPLRVFKPDQVEVLQPVPGAIRIVQSVIDLYVENLHGRHRAADYSCDALDSALRELHRFSKEFGHQELSVCRQHDLTRWFGLNPQWRAVSMKKKVASIIIGCFKWAHEEELIDRQPYRFPKALKGQPDKVRRPAEPWEYVTLMRFGSRPLRRALFMLRRTGIRTKEMRELVWPEVDLGESPHISLERHKTRRSTGKAKTIGLDTATANFLRALKRNQRGKSDRVFTNAEGTPWDCHTFAQHLRRYAERLGIDDGVDERVSAYCFRHTYVVDGIEAGLTTRAIADQVGHASTAIIDKFYGSHTRARVPHLDNVATEILTKRKRSKKPKSAERRDGFRQADLFGGLLAE